MGWPQIIWIAGTAMGLGISLVKHGQQRGTYNFWSVLIATGIEVLILSYGGFFG